MCIRDSYEAADDPFNDAPECACSRRGRFRRAARRCLQRLIAFDRRARVEQHTLAAEPLIQPGMSHDLEDTGVQPHQPDPVSYTHLDVYKRQVQDRAMGALTTAERDTFLRLLRRVVD